jgi:hypothetical protein
MNVVNGEPASPWELDVTTARSKDDQMALLQDASLGNGAGHGAGSKHAL